MDTATLAGGCFWCTEAVFRRLKGVSSVLPGYSGGEGPEPTYEQVCSGKTGYAEAIQIGFDPALISYEALLGVFFKLHDPTTLNRQGADVGTQYRSAIFYNDEAQREAAESVKQAVEASGTYRAAVVTEIVPYVTFYAAEDYHQEFYERNSASAYCQAVIDPKIEKLYKDFGALTT